MHFERNNLITDTMEDEELLARAKQNKGKRLYGLYLLSILSKEANEENPFTVKMLCLRLLERYGVFADITTIRSYIKKFQTLENYTLEGLPNDGYYLKPLNHSLLLQEEERLEDYQIHYLVESIRNSNKLSIQERNSVIEKLANMCNEEVNKDYLLDKAITGKTIDKQKSYLLTRLYDDIPRIIKEQLVMEIKRKRLGSNGVVDYKPRKFYLYATIPVGYSFILIGTYSLKGNAMYLFSSQIEDYKVLDEHFEKAKLKMKPSLVILGEERIKLLEKEYPNDFIFPTEKEWKDLKDRVQNQINERKTKNEI